jgi:protein involved in polysaccharide export with SLBB domain
MAAKNKALCRRCLSAGVLSVLLLGGCSLSGGNRLTFFPEGHPLTDAAKAVRQSGTPPVPVPRELDKRVLAPYVVEPGDVLLVQSVDLDSPVRLPADQPVLPDGTINLGRYGRVIVAGQTVDEIERIVQATVNARTKDAGAFAVRVTTRQSKVYYVLGEVNAPGSFQLNGRETVLDGILAAGGLTDRASRGNIILTRPTAPDACRVVLPVCYRDIVQLGDTSTNYQLAPGDRIFVPSRSCRESGLFGRSKKDCTPCGGPQVPCPAPSGCPERFGGATVVPVQPASVSAPADAPATVAPVESGQRQAVAPLRQAG